MTTEQRKMFFRLFQKACAIQGIPPKEREAFRHSLIAEAVPSSNGSLTLVGTGASVDALMARVATLANDYEAAMKWSLAPGKRLARMCEAEVWQLWSIENGLGHASRSRAITPGEYIQSILAQAGWGYALYASAGEWWLDLIKLDKLLKMLDTHRRRLLAKVAKKRDLAPDGSERPMRLAFDLRSQYRWEGNLLTRTLEDTRRRPLVNIRCVALATQ